MKSARHELAKLGLATVGEWDALQPPCRSLAEPWASWAEPWEDSAIWSYEIPGTAPTPPDVFFLILYGDIWIIYGWHSRSREKVLLTSDLRRMQSFPSKPVASSWASAAVEEVKLICSKMFLDLQVQEFGGVDGLREALEALNLCRGLEGYGLMWVKQ